ncbi:MAG: N-acetylmuramoyl-L-alanine amidase [Myxococcota bacterium]
MADDLVSELPTLRLYSGGPSVVLWQKFLVAKGHSSGAPDGMFGNGAKKSTESYQRSIGVGADGVVGRGTYEKAIADGFDPSGLGYGAATDPNDPASVRPAPGFTPTLVDAKDRGAAKLASKHRRSALRSAQELDKVDGIVLHQMSFYRKGDTIDRYADVPAHYIITQQGELAQLHDHNVYLYTSNSLNATTVGVEFAGNFASTSGSFYQKQKFWACVLTPHQVSAARLLLETVQRDRGITKVYSHIQAYAGRSNCGGPDIWASVGQWGVDVLRLSDGGPGWKKDDGAEIPDVWRTWGRA